MSEAERGQTKADFYAKMSIALKEANETQYWLKLLWKTDYLTDTEYYNITKDSDEIIRMLVSITKTTKQALSE